MKSEESQSELHRFKAFLNDHPALIRNIRRNGKSWQDVYEQWVLLGETDRHWEQFKEEDQSDGKSGEADQETKGSKIEFSKDTVKQILKYTESMDMEKLQHQVQQLSHTVAAIQEVVGQFQTTKNPEKTAHPFHWFRD